VVQSLSMNWQLSLKTSTRTITTMVCNPFELQLPIYTQDIQKMVKQVDIDGNGEIGIVLRIFLTSCSHFRLRRICWSYVKCQDFPRRRNETSFPSFWYW
jgi:hypothetical protein